MSKGFFSKLGTSRCQGCSKQFSSVFSSRKHCEICEHVVCAECYSGVTMIPERLAVYDFKESSACCTCFLSMQRAIKDSPVMLAQQAAFKSGFKAGKEYTISRDIYRQPP